MTEPTTVYGNRHPEYVGIYKMTEQGEALLARGKKFGELQEGKDYALFTVLSYDEFINLSAERTLERIIRELKG